MTSLFSTNRFNTNLSANMNLKTFLITHKILQMCLTEISTAGRPGSSSWFYTERKPQLHFVRSRKDKFRTERTSEKKEKVNKDQQLQGSRVYDWPMKSRALSANIWKSRASRVNTSFLELWDFWHGGNEDLLNHLKICFGPGNSSGSSHTEKSTLF